jgi:hypothetical protein
MSEERRRKLRVEFAERAVELAGAMRTAPPVLFLCDPETGEHETPDCCPLSGEAGRVAMLAMTFCNPLALQAASAIEGMGT